MAPDVDIWYQNPKSLDNTPINARNNNLLKI